MQELEQRVMEADRRAESAEKQVARYSNHISDTGKLHLGSHFD